MATYVSSMHQALRPLVSSSNGVVDRHRPRSRVAGVCPYASAGAKAFRRQRWIAARALREWQDYEDAVKRKDLAGALRFLLTLEEQEDELPIKRFDDYSSSLAESTRPWAPRLAESRWERDWEILDTCLNAEDLKLVGSAYAFLKAKGFLPNFGKFRNIVLEGPRDVTPTVLKSVTGLEASKLSPKKWGLSGSSSAFLVAFLGGISFLLSQGIDVRPNLAAVLGLSLIDSIFLGGCCLAQISSYWPPYRRRILVHEAGHLLAGRNSVLG